MSNRSLTPVPAISPSPKVLNRRGPGSQSRCHWLGVLGTPPCGPSTSGPELDRPGPDPLLLTSIPCPASSSSTSRRLRLDRKCSHTAWRVTSAGNRWRLNEIGSRNTIPTAAYALCRRPFNFYISGSSRKSSTTTSETRGHSLSCIISIGDRLSRYAVTLNRFPLVHLPSGGLDSLGL